MSQVLVSPLIHVGLNHRPSSTFSVNPRRQLRLRNLAHTIDHLKGGQRIEAEFHEVEHKVRDYELDQYGVVNNATYASLHEHLKRISTIPDEVARNGEALAIAELSLKYLAPLRSGDRFVVKVRIYDSSAARLFFQHFIFKLPDQEPILEARGTAVWLNKSYRPVRIPSEFRSKVSLHSPGGI